LKRIETIGFIGLGTMGGAMAANLARAGFTVTGFDPVAGAAAALLEVGGAAAATPAEAADGAELVIVMVPDVPEIRATLEGEGGLLGQPGAGRILMVMCTIDPGAVQTLSELTTKAGWRYVDCPVGRTADDARAGNSTFMLGGAEEDKAAVTPALEAMGTAIIDCGDVGHGMRAKIVNNFLSTAGAVLVAEALRLAESGGLSASTALEIVNGTVAGNGHSRTHFPSKVLSGDVRPGFAIRHAAKDCRIAATVMAREGFPNFVAPAVVAAYDAAIECGHGDNDWSDLYHVVSELKDGG
jgi:4-hydroxybutyrate dehydrogenase/sulfolactaldehyde 3-reductase